MSSGGGESATARRVRSILAVQAVLELEDVKLSDTLEGLGIDSLGLVEAIFAIEETFDISVPFNASEPAQSPFDVSSVGAIIAAVDALIAAR